jgi:hypothetical protein
MGNLFSKAPSAPRTLAHIECPAAVTALLYPCFAPGAKEALYELEKEISLQHGDNTQFFAQVSEWGPKNDPDPMIVMTAMFPRDNVARLAELCYSKGLILMLSAMTIINGKTKARIYFDLAAAVAGTIDIIPGDEDSYCIWERDEREDPDARIVCGAHEDEIPDFLRQ